MPDPNLPDAESLYLALREGLRTRLADRLADSRLIGIHTGGAWIAERLATDFGHAEGIGTLDISYYRDDYQHRGLHPSSKPSRIPFPVDDADLILVDDVVHSGRTVRAALNELFDYGRPRRILLAALVDREGRELPIQPDVVGARLRLADGLRLKLAGPSPLALRLKQGPGTTPGPSDAGP